MKGMKGMKGGGVGVGFFLVIALFAILFIATGYGFAYLGFGSTDTAAESVLATKLPPLGSLFGIK